MTFSSDVGRAYAPGAIRTWAGPIVALLIFAVCGAVVVDLGVVDAKPHFTEASFVEMAMPVILPLTAVLYVLWMGRLGLRSYIPPLLLMLMAWRELDGDRWFTAKSILSTGYYFDNPGVSYTERIVVGTVMAALGLVTLRFFWATRRRILTALRQMQPHVRSILLGLALIPASLLFDGLDRKFLGLFGTHLPENVSLLAGIMEETSELAMAALFLVALLQLRFDSHANTLPDAR